MSTLIHPPLSAPSLPNACASTLAAELTWLLTSLQSSLASLKAGLEECAALLSPTSSSDNDTVISTTLVLSSLRSENLKGYITRIGARITKGEIHLRIPSLPIPRGQGSYKLSITSDAASTLVIPQVATARARIDACLDVVDVMRWHGGGGDAEFMAGQLRLLHENLGEALGALKGGGEGGEGRAWNEDPVDEEAFTPPLPGNLSFHLSVADAAVVLHVRTLQSTQTHSHAHAHTPHGTSTPPIPLSSSSSYSGLSLRDRLSSALTGFPKPAPHDEAEQIFAWKGGEVRVREKVRVESQDPRLMSALAKLGALGRSVGVWRRGLGVLMGREGDEDDG